MLRCWSNCHSISKLLSDHHHHHLQGKLILRYMWQHPTLHMPIFHQNVIMGFGAKEGNANAYNTCSKLICIMDYENDKFIHAQTCTYNKVVQLLELAGGIEHA